LVKTNACWPLPNDLKQDWALRSLRLFAEEIMPAFH